MIKTEDAITTANSKDERASPNSPKGPAIKAQNMKALKEMSITTGTNTADI
jgi:hypothetical protein